MDAGELTSLLMGQALLDPGMGPGKGGQGNQSLCPGGRWPPVWGRGGQRC